MIQDIRNIEEQQANEWFIGAHGGEFFPAVNQKKFLNKMKSFFGIYNEKKVKSDLMFKGIEGEDESMQIVLWRILLATSNKYPEAVNIVHIHACHSGAAQNYLKSVPGNFVLCTYSKENKSTITEFSKILYENRFKNTNLIDFISDNFHLLASVNFKISYKFGKKVSSFSLDSDNIKNITDNEALKLFLNSEYNKFIKFHSNLYNRYNKKFPEIFGKKLLAGNKEFTENELSKTIETLLALEIANYNESSLAPIENLLKYKNLDLEISLLQAVASNNIPILNLLLNHDCAVINKHVLSITVSQNNPQIAEIIFEHITNELNIAPYINYAICENPQIAEIVLKYYTGKLEDISIYSVINKAKDNNDYLKLFEDIAKHPNMKSTLFTINDTIVKNNPQVAGVALKYYTGNLDNIKIYSVIDKVKDNQDYLKLFESIVTHPNIKLTPNIIKYAISRDNSQITDIVQKYNESKTENINPVIDVNVKIDLGIIDVNNNSKLLGYIEPIGDIIDISIV